VAKTTSGFNSDHIVRQYAHGLLLESHFCTIWYRFNFLTLVSYSLLQAVFR